MDSTFMKAYSRRGRKGGISDRGARVGKTERRSYQLGWRAHTMASMSALPIAYTVRAANVNDKDLVKPQEILIIMISPKIEEARIVYAMGNCPTEIK